MDRQRQVLEDMFFQSLSVPGWRVMEVTGDWVNRAVFLFQAKAQWYSLIMETELYGEVKICAGILISKSKFRLAESSETQNYLFELGCFKDKKENRKEHRPL